MNVNEILSRKNFKKVLFLITFTIILLVVAFNYKSFFSLIGRLLSILTPFFVGIGIAFVINILLKLLEEKVFGFLNKPKIKNGKVVERKIWKKIKRPLCVILSFILVLALLVGLVFFVVPQLANSLSTLVSNLPTYYTNTQNYILELIDKFDIDIEKYLNFDTDFNSIISKVTEFASKTVPQIFNFTKGVTSSVWNFIMGVIFAVYMLISKESLCRNCKRSLYALCKRKKADKIQKIASLTNKSFYAFVTGQLTEAVIIGILCFIGMTIFKMPYAILISTTIAVTSLIPIFGAFIGVVPGVIILLMDKPITALWFLIFIIVLQNVEGNLIYPKVVGSSVGLPGIWVLLAITVGGSLMGLVGMLISIPIASVCFALFKEYVSRRLEDKKINVDYIDTENQNKKEQVEEIVNG